LIESLAIYATGCESTDFTRAANRPDRHLPSMATLTITNPATGKHIAKLPADDPKSVRGKFAAAREAQPHWAAVPLKKRLESIAAFRAGILRDVEDLARTLSTEMGKPVAQARNELKGLLPRLDFFLSETPRALRPETARQDRKLDVVEKISHEPLGVVANISAWNYPYFVGSNVFVPALLAGNAVLYKPSEFATLSGLNIARLLHDSGVPNEVFAPVIGTGEVGSALLREPIDGLFFTGSVATGRKIARALSGRMIKMQLELGGKDPVYVCDDAPVAAAAAAIADGAFYNTGQSCCSVERVYVHEAIFEPFVAGFVDSVKSFKIGDPLEEDTYIGPLTRSAQIAVLEGQIADAKQKGARVLTGGKRLRGYGRGNYFAPTVLVDVNHRMAVMRDESFGPVIALMKVRDDPHAVGLMNDTSYGLTAGVYTPDEKRAREILGQVNAGSAYWNCCDRVSPWLPWSGRKDSGMGLTLSRDGIRAFTQPKAWHLRRS
jgi:acyl-CoA reductase-like NAD-dependent aldehyde dehydrogenase